jgi:hypothetical protein
MVQSFGMFTTLLRKATSSDARCPSFALMALLCVIVGGCSSGEVYGEWSGTLVEVPVRRSAEAPSVEFTAVGLAVRAGPAYRPPREAAELPEWRDIAPEEGDGRLPLLARGEPPRLFSTSKYGPGTRVVVRGRMCRSQLYPPTSFANDITLHRLSTGSNGGYGRLEHLIVVDSIRQD